MTHLERGAEACQAAFRAGLLPPIPPEALREADARDAQERRAARAAGVEISAGLPAIRRDCRDGALEGA